MLSSLLETSYRMLFLLLVALAIHPSAILSLIPGSTPPAGLGEGYWHTRGGQLLDAQSHPVRITGINWYGFETTKALPGGLDQQDYRTILQLFKQHGYNTIRIPLSNQMVETPLMPAFDSPDLKFSNHDGPINTDLRGLNSLQILDKIVAYAGSQGLKVILDNHRSEAGGGPEATGLWFTDAYPESAWIADWQMLAQRYAGNPTVLGFDLRNEPHNANHGGACWGCGGPNDWRFAAERAGNAVLALNPKLLIFVEGVDAYENDYYWWGGNLEGVRTAPVRLNVPHQLVYSAHDYGPAESGQPWFTPEMSSDSLNAVWTRHWAYIAQQNIAPVWLGEFGLEAPQSEMPTTAEAMEKKWFDSLIQFLRRDDRISWTYWAANGADRYGILAPAYDRIRNSAPQDALASIQTPLSIRIQNGPKSDGLKSSRSAAASPAGAAETVIVPQGTSNYADLPLPQVGQPAVPSQATQASNLPVDDTPQSATNEPGTLKPQSTRSAPIQCRVTYTVLNDWHTGFTTGVVIHNTGRTPIHGWVLSWSFDSTQRITQLWNGRYDQEGPAVTVTNEVWNAIIPAGGEQAGIGFNADRAAQNHAPVKFILNGTACK